MAWEQSIDISGAKELLQAFKRISASIDDKKMEDELNAVGQGLKKEIQSTIRQVAYDTGRLYNSVRAQKFKRKVKNNPATFVAMDRSKTKGAPHAWLVEFGSHGIRRAGQGSKYPGRSYGIMPARSYFRSTVDRKRSQTEIEIKTRTWNVVNKLANKI